MKCTINDIAKETGYSRNTVSKALKNDPQVSQRTIENIIRKAESMGYFTKEERTEYKIDQGNILFLNISHANDSQFWSNVLTGIEMVLSETNYQLTIATLSKEDIAEGRLPEAVYSSNTKGIIVVEMNFRPVWEKLLETNLPIVTVDAPKNPNFLIGKCDIVMMENHSNVEKITELLIRKGYSDFAFIGDLYSPNTGLGFMERYYAFFNTLKKHELEIDSHASILKDTDTIFENFEKIKELLNSMKKMPDVFLCGNDWLAIQLIYALQALGYRIPDDINVIGFDNIPNSEQILPGLTTIDTPKIYLGRKAAHLIMDRLIEPDIPYSISKYSTKLILRESTSL
ncbi:LacI family DNA-binding transcriptional regulator [Enterococcus raffinosus]|uniref:LacI family DNA-binding transcriptional regulator n=1 Tax=Enterococcus raffinosus TaxID=71452 RepID=UPI0021C19C80|nr:LacI family DNA-binding transcriptional regulator [Enterococcus raffinosus]UXJ96038.1 LacI family DNA-binding transcriptional regulator [Enterococcus raffinosus]